MSNKILDDDGTALPATPVLGEAESKKASSSTPTGKDGKKRKRDKDSDSSNNNGSDVDDADKPSPPKCPRSTKNPAANAVTEEEDEEEEAAAAPISEEKALDDNEKIDEDKAASSSTQQEANMRDHPDYAWLKDTKKIKNNIGKFVKLPILPCAKPKEFSGTIAKSFLLTKQRAELLERVINDNDPDEEDKGMVLCGPHGMGKSSFAYLTAAYAWVNKYAVLYIVRCFVLFFCQKFFILFFIFSLKNLQATCGAWKAKYKQPDTAFNLPADYWLEQFKLLNEDILHNEKFASVKQALNDNSLPPVYKQDSIMSALRKVDTRVVRSFQIRMPSRTYIFIAT